MEKKSPITLLDQQLADLLKSKKRAVELAHGNPTYNKDLLKKGEKELYNIAMLDSLATQLLRQDSPQVEIFGNIVGKLKGASSIGDLTELTPLEDTYFQDARQVAESTVAEARAGSVNISRRGFLIAGGVAAVVGLGVNHALHRRDEDTSQDKRDPSSKHTDAVVNAGVSGALATAAYKVVKGLHTAQAHRTPAEAFELIRTGNNHVDELVRTVAKESSFCKANSHHLR
jgi:hypothetical protein